MSPATTRRGTVNLVVALGSLVLSLAMVWTAPTLATSAPTLSDSVVITAMMDWLNQCAATDEAAPRECPFAARDLIDPESTNFLWTAPVAVRDVRVKWVSSAGLYAVDGGFDIEGRHWTRQPDGRYLLCLPQETNVPFAAAVRPDATKVYGWSANLGHSTKVDSLVISDFTQFKVWDCGILT